MPEEDIEKITRDYGSAVEVQLSIICTAIRPLLQGKRLFGGETVRLMDGQRALQMERSRFRWADSATDG